MGEKIPGKDNTMKSLFSRLKKRKGFTLVECIVAIAVFAAFCLMVVMITAGARREARLANDTEAELNGLVDNITDDDIQRGYNSSHYSTNTLNFNYSGDASGTFSISYDIINGHKNFIECPTCHHFANNSDFMNGSTPQNFNPAASNYVCPECSNIVSVQLECADCGETAHYSDCDFKYNSANKWTYSKGSGSFVCNKCGSGNVSLKDLEKYMSLSNLSVSGIAANAIRYGTVIPLEQKEVVTITDGAGAAAPAGVTASVQVSYGDGVSADLLKNPNYLADYKIRIYGVPVGDEKKVILTLPAGYDIRDLREGTSNYDLASKKVSYNVSTTDNSTISWTTNGGEITLRFKLVNMESGFSFDYDYQKSNYTYQIMNDSGSYVDKDYDGPGLAVYWFGLSGNGGSENWPITP